MPGWGRWLPYAGSGVAGGVIVLLAMQLFAPLGSLPEAMNNNDGVASWVQAIGSILAILAVAVIAGIEGRRAARALVLAQEQQRDALLHDERRAVAKRRAAREYAKSVSRGALSRCELIYSAIREHDSSLCRIADVWGRDLEFLKGQLAEVPRFLVEDPLLVEPVFRVSLLVQDVADGLRDIQTYAADSKGDLDLEKSKCADTLALIPRRIDLMKSFLIQLETAAPIPEASLVQ